MPRLPPALEAHFRDPWRSADAPAPQAGFAAENAVCGDVVEFEIAGVAERIEVRLRMSGCSASIAVASLVARTADGGSAEAARRLDVADLVAGAGGLALQQQHAVALVARAWAGALASARPA